MYDLLLPMQVTWRSLQYLALGCARLQYDHMQLLARVAQEVTLALAMGKVGG